MTEKRATVGILAAAVQRALRAPSVHNTQPWRWRIADGAVELHADPTRHLVATDPDQRDLVLSCGAALHHLRVALAAAHLSVRVHRLPAPDDRRHLATVTVRAGEPEPGLAGLQRALDDRHTDRRRFGATPVSGADIAALVAAATACGATLHPVTDPGARRRLDETLADARSRQRFADGYATELTIWSHRYAAARDGVPAEVRPRGNRTAPGLRAFPPGRLTDPDRLHPVGDGSVLFVLTTVEDEVLDRLLAGEATSAVLLTATGLGLATTPLSQAEEVPATRSRLASSVLRSPDHPQLVIRVGHPQRGPSRLGATPRRTLESVLLRG